MTGPTPLPPRLAAMLVEAAQREVVLCEVDEAEMTAIGWVPPGRLPGVPKFAGAASPYEFPGLAAARDRLLARGLAQPGASDLPVDLTALGGLRDYLTLAASKIGLHVGAWGSWTCDSPIIDARYQRRIMPVRDSEVALVERLDLLSDIQAAQAATIRVSLMPLDALLDELTNLAYRGPASDAERSAAKGTESAYSGPDRTTPQFMSQLIHDWDDKRGVLIWRTLSLFAKRYDGDWIGKSRNVMPYIKPDTYRAHLRKRFSVPDPEPKRR